MPDYGNPLWQKLVKTIADECEIEEVSAESAADAILAIPEIRDALKANTPEAKFEDYRSSVIDNERIG